MKALLLHAFPFHRRLWLVSVLMLCALLRAQSAVVINEIMALNVSTLANGGLYPDWIELYNTSASSVDLAGMSLTNLGGKKFVFPANTMLGANGYLVVWCDSATSAPGLHTLFSFKTSGEGVALLATDGVTQLDVVSFGIQLADLSIGRVPNGTGVMQLNVPTPGLANQAKPLSLSSDLRINEWMATNASSAENNYDWLELYNPDANPVALGTLVLSTTLQPFPPLEKAITNLSFIEARGFVRYFCVGSKAKGGDQLDFKLSHNTGETITFYAADRATVIDQVSFGPGVLATPSSSMGRLPDGGTNIVVFAPGATTPAASNFQLITNVVVNEVLSHTDPPLEDAIEIYNPTTSPVDISYWWISNNESDPKRFRVPAGAIIPAGGYKVFYEMIGATGGFNTSGTGNAPDFTLNSAHGDNVYIVTADASGNLTGSRLNIAFGSAQHGISFGRYITSVGKVDFVAMSQLTFGMDSPSTVQQFRTGTGRTNAYPMVGQVVINEVMYHPPGILDDTLNEYIEIYNRAITNVPLYDIAFPTNTYKLANAVDFVFPRNKSIPPGGYVLVVSFDPATNATQLAAFRTKYGVTVGDSQPNVNLFGPYSGKLKNTGDTIELYKPDPVQEPPHPDVGFVPYILIDHLKYSNNSPWPSAADGTGKALQRVTPEDYGNDPINWVAADPSPGRHQSFRINSWASAGNEFSLDFNGIAGSAYTVQYNNSLNGGAWTKLTNFSAHATSGSRQAINTLGAAVSNRFYRVVTPAQP